MNGPVDDPCGRIRERLPLFAENELKDRSEAERVRLHLAACGECRRSLAEYDDFTRVLLEAEHATLSSERPNEPWAAGEPLAVRDGGEGDFALRVMAAISARRRVRSGAGLRRLAALFLVVTGLAAGAGIGFLAMRSAREPLTAPAGLVFERGSPPSAPAVFVTAGGVVKEGRNDPAISPSDALWMIGPETGSAEAVPLGTQAVFYGSFADDPAVRSRRQWLMLKAILGDPSLRAIAPGGGYSLLLLPEEGAERDTRALRPVTLPVRLTEDELAPPTRRRLNGPERRYRILWAGDAQPPVLLQPVYLPSGGTADGPFLLPIPWTGPLPGEWVQGMPERS